MHRRRLHSTTAGVGAQCTAPQPEPICTDATATLDPAADLTQMFLNRCVFAGALTRGRWNGAGSGASGRRHGDGVLARGAPSKQCKQCKEGMPGLGPNVQAQLMGSVL